MNTLSIALDVEGVLADSHAATAECSDFLEPEHCPPPDWDFPSDDHYEEFMHVSQNLWHNHNHNIPPMVDNLWKATRKMARRHDVDIVTHRQNVDQQVVEWLEDYNVHYENFHVSKGHKTDVEEYDVHIDDSPNVAADALEDGRYVLLIDRPYNQSVEPHSALHRVSDVHEAAEFLASADVDVRGHPE